MINSDRHDYNEGTEIAIVGMAGRFPGARNIDEFWANLRDGVESIRKLTDDELLKAGLSRETLNDPGYVRAAAVLDDAYSFDADFFGFTPREAEIMDPQHRVLLETAWEALENAGYNPLGYSGAIGVFAGCTINTYLLVNIASNPRLTNSLENVQINVANGGDFLTTRISYKLNLRGPSHVVQSACSTSLVAVHLACQSLLNDESDIALAGGVSINETLRLGYRYTPGGMVSPDGHCRAFDAHAQGTVFGSGVGVVVLKPLHRAIEDGDTIHAIIKGSAVNNDGSLKVGYTAPSVDGQAEVITEAIANAGVDPETIGYIEAHGTGTPLGDPVEIQALTKAFAGRTSRKGFCAIGSVKSNIGHLDAAAGVTGLIKTILALKHGLIPPSLHFSKPNPEIDFSNTPFFVNTEPQDWKSNGLQRRAGVSAFGVGGTNAHVVLEEAPERCPSSGSRRWQPLVLSAKTETALKRAAVSLASHLARNPDASLPDIAFTLAVGRAPFPHRRMLVCRDTSEAAAALAGEYQEKVNANCAKAGNKKIVFMFPGQGVQYASMGRRLYEQEGEFREHVDRCARLLESDLGLDIRNVLYPSPGCESEATEKLNQTWITQPALFVIEYSLAKMWMAWGVRPLAMIGHSIGEYVAASIAGVMADPDALRLVAARGRLMQSLPEGAMLSVALSEDEANALTGPTISLAAVNSPSQCVLSGTPDAIDALERKLVEEGYVCRRLRTSHAFHSEMMAPILDAFRQEVETVRLKEPQIPIISNLTGTWLKSSDAVNPGYWVKHLRQTVRFGDGIRELLRDPDWVLLETGPGQTTSKIARRHLEREADHSVVATFRDNDIELEVPHVITSLGELWTAGVEVDWAAFYRHEKRQRVSLPTYPFERERYWIEPGKRSETQTRARPNEIHKNGNIAEWFYVPSWRWTIAGPAPAKSSKGRTRRWLVLEDQNGIGARLAELIRGRGDQVVRVSAGGAFERANEEEYRIDPANIEHYERLRRDTRKNGEPEEFIIHLLSLSEYRDSEAGRFANGQQGGFSSLVALAQALDNGGFNESLKIAVVSNNLHAVTAEEKVDSAKVTVLGACTVIPQEYPGIFCKCIDVVLPEPGSSRETLLIEQVLAEIESESMDVVVSYRGAQRWVRQYEPVVLERDGAAPTALREGGVYLITGGLTGIGYAIAQRLASTVRARLVLIEGEPFPTGTECERWQPSRGGENDIASKVIRVKALGESGAGVLVLGIDLHDPHQFESAVVTAIERFGRINGVIHASSTAGEKAFRTLRETNLDEAEAQLESSRMILCALEKAISNERPDFVIINSSLSAVLGGLGYGSFAASNLLIDAFARNHNAVHSTRWTSINWDAWHLEDEEVQLATINAELGRLAISPEEGAEALHRILMLSNMDQIVVSTGDLQARIARWVGRQQGEKTQAKEPAGTRLHPRPALSSQYVAPSSELERAIAAIWQAALGIEDVGVLDRFFDLGGDSLLAVQVIGLLRRELNLDIPVVSLYEGVTIRSLVSLIAAEAGEEQAAAAKSREADERMERMLNRKQVQLKQRSRKKGITI